MTRSVAPSSVLELEDLLWAQTEDAAANMRVLHYPPQTGPVDDRMIGIGAHSEYVWPLSSRKQSKPRVFCIATKYVVDWLLPQ